MKKLNQSIIILALTLSITGGCQIGEDGRDAELSGFILNPSTGGILVVDGVEHDVIVQTRLGGYEQERCPESNNSMLSLHMESLDKNLSLSFRLPFNGLILPESIDLGSYTFQCNQSVGPLGVILDIIDARNKETIHCRAISGVLSLTLSREREGLVRVEGSFENIETTCLSESETPSLSVIFSETGPDYRIPN